MSRHAATYPPRVGQVFVDDLVAARLELAARTSGATRKKSPAGAGLYLTPSGFQPIPTEMPR